MNGKFGIFLYFVFLSVMAVFCFKRPAESFDRYIYEAIVIGRRHNLDTAYKHILKAYPVLAGSPRLQNVSGLAEIEPMFTIRPIYLGAVGVANGFLDIDRAMSIVAAISIFGLGVVLFVWTQKPLYSALIMASPVFVLIGRQRGPDGASTLFISTACLLIWKKHLLPGIAVLLASIWVRTDNVIFVAILLGWLFLDDQIKLSQLAALWATALASLFLINHYSGNYGWQTLFMNSFCGIYSFSATPPLTLTKYLRAIGQQAILIPAQQMPIWIILGCAAWKWAEEFRPLLACAALAALLRFALFPSPDDRYFVWAYVIVAAAFIFALSKNRGYTSVESGM